MKSILYIMSIPWGWIKQRPHFLAEEFSKNCKVDVYYRKANHRLELKEKIHDETEELNLHVSSFRQFPFHVIPIIKSLPYHTLEGYLIKRQLPNFENYDFVYFASPILFSLLYKYIPSKTKIVYDCMDDYAEFANVKSDIKAYTRMLECEKRILECADYVICSSEYLKSKICSRAKISRADALVVNNAIDIPTSNDLQIPEEINEKIESIKVYKKILMYVGAVSEWFDFDAVMAALEDDDSLHVVLVGPVIAGSGVIIPVHERIHTFGPVKREYIFTIMSYATALIMPFKVSELIKSVNPVKLYEYIYTGKPVISSRYQETERFSEFVNLYSTSSEFVDIVKSIRIDEDDECYKERCKAFVLKNTWENRKDMIMAYINN